VRAIGQPNKDGRVQDGRDLKPKLIDVFHLTPKGATSKTGNSS
jgi:hypothetical protein